MEAVQVDANGLLVVEHASALPDAVRGSDLLDMISGINRQLIERGERIETINDFNRAIELYAEGTIELEDSRLTAHGYVLEAARAGDVIVPLAGSSGGTLIPDSNNSVSRQNRPTRARGGVMSCRIRPHYPHKSTGTVKAKADGRCTYEGDYQTFTSELHFLLQQWIEWWFWGYYYTHDINAPNTRRGGAPFWPDNSIWVFAPYCQTATYRSRAELYVTGSFDGRATPYPYVVVSLPVWIECP